MNSDELREKRAKIKKTVEQIAPALEEVVTTRVLTDEEQLELARKFEEAKTNKDLATKLGREGLKAALRRSLAQSEQAAIKVTQRLEPPSG